jgi:hypothetical protein
MDANYIEEVAMPLKAKIIPGAVPGGASSVKRCESVVVDLPFTALPSAGLRRKLKRKACFDKVI